MEVTPLKNGIYHSVTHGQLEVDEVIDYIKYFLEEDPDAEYSLVIGTDSHEKAGAKNGVKSISLVTAILVHRKGTGGKYFWKRLTVHNIHSL